MSETFETQLICDRCRAVLDAGDRYCRHCGAATSPPAGGLPGWTESPWVILPLLFLVMGPLAFPLLWWSRRFSLFWKIVLTVIVSASTAGLVWITWLSVQQTLNVLRDMRALH